MLSTVLTLMRRLLICLFAAAGAVTSALPVVGRHIEPFAGIAALGVWGIRYLPDFVSSALRSRMPS